MQVPEWHSLFTKDHNGWRHNFLYIAVAGVLEWPHISLWRHPQFLTFLQAVGAPPPSRCCRTGAACEGGTGQRADLFADTNCSLFRLNWIGMSRLPGKGLIQFSKPAYLTQSSFISSFLWAGSPQVLEVCWLYQYNVLHLEFAYQCDVAVLSIVPICHHCYMKCLVGTSRFDKTK